MGWDAWLQVHLLHLAVMSEVFKGILGRMWSFSSNDSYCRAKQRFTLPVVGCLYLFSLSTPLHICYPVSSSLLRWTVIVNT